MPRTEEDSLGTVEVPEDAYYGAFTQRAKENFQISGETPPRALIRALGQVKEAAAKANRDLDLLDGEAADAIIDTAGEVQEGEFDDQFVVDMLQAGAGTPLHMNANEVIANRATELLGGELGDYAVHPNDDVNMGQSSNNVVPTATRLATIDRADDLVAELEALRDAFTERGEEYADTVKVGRTHLQDAVPVTLGQEFDAYATHIDTGIDRLSDALVELHAVGLGSNAVGTGINTPPAFREAVVDYLSQVTGCTLRVASDPIATTQSMAPFARFAGALDALLTDLLKMGDDLMLLSSGPKTGLAEISLPAVEPGSSIMPGKVNPSIVEAFKMTCLQAQGNLSTVRHAAAEGDLDMHVMAPVIARNLLNTLTELTSAARMLREKCVAGIEADADRIDELFAGSTATATALSPYLGYDRVADVVHAALDGGNSVRDEVLDRGWMTEAELDEVLDPGRMTGAHGVDTELQERVQERLDGDG